MTATITSSTARKIATRGYLYDIYHIKDTAILWLKEENDGNVKKSEYLWPSFVYVVSDKRSELELLLKNQKILSFIKDYEFEYKFEYPSDCNKREVLKLILNDSSQIVTLAKYIEYLCLSFDHYRLYNVDVLPEQAFLYDKDFYPLGLYDVVEEKLQRSNIFDLNLITKDKSKYNENVKDSFDYIIPNFKYLSFDIVSQRKTKIANDINDKILKIIVTNFDKNNNNIKETFVVSKEDESETLLEFAYQVKKQDPDIILTKGGDQFLFPHLLYRAKISRIESQLLLDLNRESDLEFLQKKYESILKADDKENNSKSEASSSSFISYGKVYFKPRPFYLYGRIHIDNNNSFIYKDNGLDGLAEISRVCKIPLQIASRSTIGKCLSSLYFYNAQRNDILIPWKPKVSETFKTFNDLILADKGGFIFESKPDAYEQVAEFDFVSLYPNIMMKKNISSETINCYCCRNDQDNKVPGLEHLYHICKKKTGIVPLSLKTVLDRRLEYKNRKKNVSHYCQSYYNHDHLSTTVNNNKKDELLNCYDNRQAALKWILVTSFGYLGFSNSKFGRIDAHIAVCAFARDILFKVSKIVESYGFEIIHGIVDSIWIKRNSIKSVNGFNNYKSYENLKKEIEDKTGFSISFEGKYKWIVFDCSKEDDSNDLPALNRYFGVFKDGNTIKTRGIEARRHDTPPLFAKFQEELLQKMSYADSIDDVKIMMPLLEEIYKNYIDLIYYKKVHFSELVFTKRISKDSDEYSKRNTIESCVINLLSNNGKSLYAGQEIKYIITGFDNKNNPKRAIPIELLEQDSSPNYDTTRYCKLLYDCYNSIVKYFE
jgi:DNA polymerase I